MTFTFIYRWADCPDFCQVTITGHKTQSLAQADFLDNYSFRQTLDFMHCIEGEITQDQMNSAVKYVLSIGEL
jgi:hypothetical protein